jgi:hypothetical protein
MFQKLAELEPTLQECLTRVDANRRVWNDIVSDAAAARW